MTEYDRVSRVTFVPPEGPWRVIGWFMVPEVDRRQGGERREGGSGALDRRKNRSSYPVGDRRSNTRPTNGRRAYIRRQT